MREILFRGKSNWSYGNVKEGDWLYGMTISRHVYNDEEITSYYIGGGNNTIYGNTLGQYTGLTDKNGKKIFEGDVCQTKGYKLIDETPFIVVWNDYYSGFYWEDVKNANDTDMFTKTVAEITEVIGNIHDNPELLKGGD